MLVTMHVDTFIFGHDIWFKPFPLAIGSRDLAPFQAARNKLQTWTGG